MNSLADVVVPTNVPNLPWGVIGACIILGAIGIALWKTTIGKVLIVAVCAIALTVMAMKTGPH